MPKFGLICPKKDENMRKYALTKWAQITQNFMNRKDSFDILYKN